MQESKITKSLFLMVGAMIVVGLMGLLFIGGVEVGKKTEPLISFGSVSQANEYHSTTTFNGIKQILSLTTSTEFFDKRTGALGSLIITRPGATINFYDATTTNRLLRDRSNTTNTIRLGSFPAETVAGTYVFDTNYRNGLIVEFGSTDVPSSTVTFR